ncbi:MAG: RsmE family RNA methyltransferase [Ilumatobacteraceae bacterium]
MNPHLRSSAAHVFVDSLDAPALSDEDAHHLFRVLRLRDGEVVSASDGLGRWRPCVARSGSLDPTGPIQPAAAAPAVTVAAAVPKGDRLDWMVQKLVEVGVQRIVLLDSARGVVRWDADRVPRQLDRLRRMAREAASQSRRVWLPRIEGPCAVATVLAEPGAVLADPDGEPLIPSTSLGPVLVGPEGGWDRVELAAADAAGASRVSLGATVLRVETAAVVAGVLASPTLMPR